MKICRVFAISLEFPARGKADPLLIDLSRGPLRKLVIAMSFCVSFVFWIFVKGDADARYLLNCEEPIVLGLADSTLG